MFKVILCLGFVVTAMFTINNVNSLAVCDFPVSWELTSDWQDTLLKVGNCSKPVDCTVLTKMGYGNGTMYVDSDGHGPTPSVLQSCNIAPTTITL